MRYYDHRIGVVSDVRPARTSLFGCHGLGCLGALGAEDCAPILAEVNRILAIARTRNKKHRKEGEAVAAREMQRYQRCLSARAATPTPVTPVVTPPAATPPSVSPEPIPYVPMVGGGGGGSSSYPEMVPMPDGSDGAVMSSGYCVDAAGTQIACPQTGGSSGFFTPSGQPIPMGTGQITQTNQFTSTGQPVFYNATNGQTFYYGPTGQPVYFTQAVQPTVSTVTQQPQLYTDPTTGRQFYYDPATGQQVYTTPAAGTGLQLASQALTPVPYAQMPTNGGRSGGDGELVPYGEGASAFAQPSAMPQPTMQAGMVPQAAAYGQPAAQQYTINEKDLIAQNGPTEYTDKWGTIKVLGLVFPAAKARAAAAAAQTVSTSGQGVLPGGEMKVEDFTAQYVLEGGQW